MVLKVTPELYRKAHFRRLIESTTGLWRQDNSICKKCHVMEDDKLCCLFCYCPLYHDPNCGGDYIIVKGIKDCSNCIKPHTEGFVMGYLEKLYSR